MDLIFSKRRATKLVSESKKNWILFWKWYKIVIFSTKSVSSSQMKLFARFVAPSGWFRFRAAQKTTLWYNFFVGIFWISQKYSSSLLVLLVVFVNVISLIGWDHEVLCQKNTDHRKSPVRHWHWPTPDVHRLRNFHSFAADIQYSTQIMLVSKV